MTDQLISVAGSTVKCTGTDAYACRVNPDLPGVVMVPVEGVPQGWASDCEGGCKGTGRVYLFPDETKVRVRHGRTHHVIPGTPTRHLGFPGSYQTCEEAGCPGWSPSTDPVVWLEAWDITIGRDNSGQFYARAKGKQRAPNNYEYEYGLGQKPLEALVSALARALIAQGAILWTPEPA